MPITIKLLEINTNVTGNTAQKNSESLGDSKSSAGGGALSRLQIELIIQEACQRVLEEIGRRKGR